MTFKVTPLEGPPSLETVTVFVPFPIVPGIVTITVASYTVMIVASVLPIFTPIVPARFDPRIMIGNPAYDTFGFRSVTTGAGIIVNVLLFDVPAAVTTETLTAPALRLPGTTTWICVSVLLISVVTTVELKFIDVALARLDPLMVSVVPVAAVVGEMELMSGGRITVKLPELFIEPPGVVTDITPDVAETGTVAV